jgi:hypothetical protein
MLRTDRSPYHIPVSPSGALPEHERTVSADAADAADVLSKPSTDTTKVTPMRIREDVTAATIARMYGEAANLEERQTPRRIDWRRPSSRADLSSSGPRRA